MGVERFQWTFDTTKHKNLSGVRRININEQFAHKIQIITRARVLLS